MKDGSHNSKGTATLVTETGVTGGTQPSKKGAGDTQCEHGLYRVTGDNMKQAANTDQFDRRFD